MSRIARIYIPMHTMTTTIPAGTAAYTSPWDAFSVALDGRYPVIAAYLTLPLKNGRTVKPLDARRPLRLYATAHTRPTPDRLIDLIPDQPKDRFIHARARVRSYEK